MNWHGEGGYRGEGAQKKDYRAVLGVGSEASMKEIQKAFHKLAEKYHPDKNQGDKDAEAKMKEISAAYEALRASHSSERREEEDDADSEPVLNSDVEQLAKENGYTVVRKGSRDSNWVVISKGGLDFHMYRFDEAGKYGVRGGRISKLHAYPHGKGGANDVLVEYERKDEPYVTTTDQKVFDAVEEVFSIFDQANQASQIAG